jgi:YD repeat-containing protein
MGRELTATLPDLTVTRRRYNRENRLESLVTSNKTGKILASFLYSYDGVGNKLSMTEEDGGVTRYSYDAANRLTGVIYPERILPKVVNYTYDPAGNRIKTVEDDRIITSRYNEANQLLQSGNTSYSYDDNGNRISRTTEEGSSFYHYSADNFLTAFTSVTGLKTIFLV